jgi:4-amino-4-deoxy-L-arabinose transferase-like glycosyltransferase
VKLALTAIAAVTAVCAWLAFVALAPDAVYSGDFGIKFVQAREVWDHHFTSMAIEPRNTFLDADGRFSPLRAPFVFKTPVGTQAIFPPAAAVLQAIFVPIGGLLGMRLLSLLSCVLTLWATWRLSPRGWTGAALPIVIGLATPLWFYAVIESEHAPAVALAAVAFVLAFSGRDEGRLNVRALAAGLALGAAAAIRDESILLVPGLLLACWSRARSWRAVAFALGGCILTLSVAAAVEVWWFGRPMAAHLRHAVHILRVALRLTSRPNQELPELHPLSLRERWDYVGQYWTFGTGSDALIAGIAAVAVIGIAARAYFKSAWPLVPMLAVLFALAAYDVYELLLAPKWVPGLYRLSPFLVFAILSPPAEASDRWLWRISLFSLVTYVAIAFAGVDTSGGKSLGPRLLLPLLPLLVAAAWRNIDDFRRAPRRPDRIAGAWGLGLAGLALIIHVAAAIPAYIVRSNEDASAMRAIRNAPERVIVADDMYTAQQLLHMYYGRVILLAETPPAADEIGMTLDRERIGGAILVSRRLDAPFELKPLKLAEDIQRGRFRIQFWRR